MSADGLFCLGRQRGFTLIEVLVAMAIVAFGLIAVFGQLNQSATAASYLRNKSLAHWVATNRLAELRLSGIFPAAGQSSDEYSMGNATWRYEETFSETPVASLRRVDITVALADDPDRPLATAVGFLVRPAPSGATGGGPGWPIPDPEASAEPETSAAPPQPEPPAPPASPPSQEAPAPASEGLESG